ncbi:MAG: type I-C CRISPR-associated protein Cas7/Csd2 [Clostridiales bacterium]|jgi:CRISPR-associated protein Csd2|nr:type I-C CRISPR-associated protein Cas7/Csd2 [Clostridiales bacterium]
MLNNKIDFAVIFAVKNANPNGDPVNMNRPRTTSGEIGEVSDVCLKRKIRNRLQAEGERIFVQVDALCDDGKKSLSDRFNDFIVGKKKEDIPAAVCAQWFDVRAFGQVFALKKRNGVNRVSIGIRGPVTIQSAFSRESITVETLYITKSVNSEPTKDGTKSSDTMGAKHRVGKAVYVTYGSISPQLAEKTGFSDGDAEKIKLALTTLFEGDESAARPSGSMEVLKVIWWRHNCKSGQYSSAKTHKSIDVDKDGNITIKQPLDGLVPEIIEG